MGDTTEREEAGNDGAQARKDVLKHVRITKSMYRDVLVDMQAYHNSEEDGTAKGRHRNDGSGRFTHDRLLFGLYNHLRPS